MNMNLAQEQPRPGASMIQRVQSWSEFAALLASGEARVVVINAGIDEGSILKAAEHVPGPHRNAPPFGVIQQIQAPGSAGALTLFGASGDLHTDAVTLAEPPRWLLNQIVEPDPSGGCPRYLAVANLVAQMPDGIREALCTEPVRYEQRTDGKVHCWEGPLLSDSDPDRAVLRWRYSETQRPTALTERGEAAFDWLRDTLEKSAHEALPVQAGDIIAVENRHVLHGRTVRSAVHWPRARVFWLG